MLHTLGIIVLILLGIICRVVGLYFLGCKKTNTCPACGGDRTVRGKKCIDCGGSGKFYN